MYLRKREYLQKAHLFWYCILLFAEAFLDEYRQVDAVELLLLLLRYVVPAQNIEEKGTQSNVGEGRRESSYKKSHFLENEGFRGRFNASDRFSQLRYLHAASPCQVPHPSKILLNH